MVATISLIGTALVLVALVLVALGISGVGGADPRTVYPAAYLVEVWLVAPLVVVALGTGVLQALLSRWGLMKYWWVTIKLVTTATFTGLVPRVIIPSLAASADAARAARTFTPAQRLPLAIVPALATAVLVLNVVLARYKPDWRLRSRPAVEAAPVTPGRIPSSRPRVTVRKEQLVYVMVYHGGGSADPTGKNAECGKEFECPLLAQSGPCS